MSTARAFAPAAARLAGPLGAATAHGNERITHCLSLRYGAIAMARPFPPGASVVPRTADGAASRGEPAAARAPPRVRPTQARRPRTARASRAGRATRHIRLAPCAMHPRRAGLARRAPGAIALAPARREPRRDALTENSEEIRASRISSLKSRLGVASAVTCRNSRCYLLHFPFLAAFFFFVAFFFFFAMVQPPLLRDP